MNAKKILCLLLSLMLLTALIGCGNNNTSSQSEEIPQSTYADYDLTKYGNVPSNILNGGKFVEKNGKIFYSDPADNGCLHVYDPAAGTHTKLTDEAAECLNADAASLYFLTGGSGYVTRMNQDGTGLTRLYGVGRNKNLLLYNGTLYFNDLNGSIHTVNADGAEEKILLQLACNSVTVYEGSVYFTDNEKYFSLLKEDGSYTRVGNIKVNSFIINNGWVYFTETEGNYPGKFQLDGPTGVYFIDVSADNLTIAADNKLYFRSISDNKLNCYAINGGGHKVISADGCDNLAYIGGKLFYQDANLIDTIRVYSMDDKLPSDFIR